MRDKRLILITFNLAESISKKHSNTRGKWKGDDAFIGQLGKWCYVDYCGLSYHWHLNGWWEIVSSEGIFSVCIAIIWMADIVCERSEQQVPPTAPLQVCN